MIRVEGREGFELSKWTALVEEAGESECEPEPVSVPGELLPPGDIAEDIQTISLFFTVVETSSIYSRGGFFPPSPREPVFLE